jgi:hypothetical protein
VCTGPANLDSHAVEWSVCQPFTRGGCTSNERVCHAVIVLGWDNTDADPIGHSWGVRNRLTDLGRSYL